MNFFYSKEIFNRWNKVINFQPKIFIQKRKRKKISINKGEKLLFEGLRKQFPAII